MIVRSAPKRRLDAPKERIAVSSLEGKFKGKRDDFLVSSPFIRVSNAFPNGEVWIVYHLLKAVSLSEHLNFRGDMFR
jgi:hypothetical protein